MIPITVQLDDKKIEQIIRTHINKKTLDLINWYTSINKSTKYLPLGYTEKDADYIIRSLINILDNQQVLELKDYSMQFALACILEEEERIIDCKQELSAAFCDADRHELEKYLPDEDIEYYESYDHFNELLLPDNAYLDLAK